MKFGIFYEHQLPPPWEDQSEYRLLQSSLEEYSHSSAPEVFLGAASQRTRAHPARPRHHPAPDQPPDPASPSAWPRSIS